MSIPGSTDFVDYYALLHVGHDAEIAEIRKAYIAQAKQQHPDAGGSTDAMQQLNTAYRTLTSPTGKAAYDMLHSFHTGTTSTGEYRYADGRTVDSVTDMTDDEIDSFLDNVFTEYRDGPRKTRQGLRQWFKNFL